MKFAAIARVTASAAVMLLCASGVGADTMVVAGRRVESRLRFVTADNEVFAPLLTALAPLGARLQLTPDSIKVTTSGEHEVLISRTRPEATRDGALRELPGLPQVRDGTLLLPAKAVGSLLGCAVRWDESTRILYLHPWVRKFSLETLPDRYRLTVGAEGPITYRTGQLDGPPRLYLDLLNLDVADIPSQFQLEGSYLRGARISQKTLWPAPPGDVVRVVVELSEWRPYRVKSSEGRRTLELEFPLPEAEELPPDAPPVVLSGLSFRRLSPRLALAALAVFGTPHCTSGSTADPPSIWVDLPNAENQIEQPEVQVSDKLVSQLTLGPSPEQPGAQRLTIGLHRPSAHAVSAVRGEVRVLLGRCELAGVRVMVDPGHGGPDPGAIGRSGLTEKEVNLEIATRVSRMLEEAGASALLTRRDDTAVIPWTLGNREEHRQELQARSDLAGDGGADLFVSIHANARASNPQSVRGTETYYRKEDSRRLAEVIQEELVAAAGLPDGGTKYHPEPIIVLYRTTVPAVLVEVAYLSNREDEQKLADAGFREQAARGVVNGIRRWVEEGGLLSKEDIQDVLR